MMVADSYILCRQESDNYKNAYLSKKYNYINLKVLLNKTNSAILTPRAIFLIYLKYFSKTLLKKFLKNISLSAHIR